MRARNEKESLMTPNTHGATKTEVQALTTSPFGVSVVARSRLQCEEEGWPSIGLASAIKFSFQTLMAPDRCPVTTTSASAQPSPVKKTAAMTASCAT